ncbi:Mannosylglycerate hydrolase [Aquisphaera giovannonii]|uniref:Mannosylglycerate hydrolase n=1 Tax=Aquisphaera giovannonii TaxID=406548 RepID=A0A5B9W081_9BACT|nr:glycoside hydrolase family 38 C-terminal domain-containing protein [Aquisphaera giovannonii]QEH33435.1 Mannosylglycerate hydrolase [Aquisphaera giovannonii]
MTNRIPLRPSVATLAALLLAASLDAAEPPASGDRPTFWVIPHTHWEGAVFKTREEYLEMGLPNILRALRLLGEQPDYRFVLDQAAYVKPFLERYPDQEPAFRKYLAEGRLQIAGGLDVMPDVNMPGGESFVRQVQYGKGYYREKLGIDVTTGWLIDTFGHHAQIPQLMTLAGFRSYWTQRGVPFRTHPAEFLWEGIDGTRLPVFYMPASYAVMYGSPADPSKFREFVIARFRSLDANAPGKDRAGPAGVDVGLPEPQLAPMVEAFNKDPDRPFNLRIATPAEFEKVVAPRTDRPVFRGEMNPIFQGTYSSRIELKSWMRRMEARLVTAEKLTALSRILGGEVSDAGLWRAWEPVLFNETHDQASGVMTDHVYEDAIRGYESSDRLAGELIDAGWNALASRIDTRGEGIPVVVFNPMSWTRSDVTEVDVGFAVPGVAGVSVVDDRGVVRPSQLVSATSYPDGGLCAARVAFVAAEVPALGYRTYHVRTSAEPSRLPSPAPGHLENASHRLAIDDRTGAITSLRVKSGDWEVLRAPANVVARHQDRGDVWELYRGLDGGSNVALSNKQPVPPRGEAKYSDDEKGTPATVVTGPVYSEYRVAHPFAGGQYATTVRLYADLPRIDCTTTLVNNEKYVRYQLLFPTSIRGGKHLDEIPFGAMERPEGIEFPAQNWSDLADGEHGLAVLNAGLPGHTVADGTIMVSVLRSHNLGAYGFGGGYEPGMSSEGAFQIGKERTARYALLPHAGDWRDAGLARAGLEFNHPLIARPVGAHAGDLPPSKGFLEVCSPSVIVTSVRPMRDEAIAVRLYESTGRPAPGTRIRLSAFVADAADADLLENPREPIAVADGALSIDFRPFQIRTLILRTRSAPR